MNKFNFKVFVIDIVISLICVPIFTIGFYNLYKLLPSRFFLALIIIGLIPLFWGNMYLSITGKKSIGRIIYNKIKKVA